MPALNQRIITKKPKENRLEGKYKQSDSFKEFLNQQKEIMKDKKGIDIKPYERILGQGYLHGKFLVNF